jgi:hypothetical protein
MAHFKLRTTLVALTKNLDQMEQLAAAAQQWASMPTPRSMPKFTTFHSEIVTEMAFLRSFLAWESFLEESFVLYLWGKNPPRSEILKRYACPPTRRVAEQLIVAEGRDYADWAEVQNVIGRAGRFFQGGEPYSDALRSQQSRLQDIKTVRNAIAHCSTYSWERFQRLIRRELGTYPSNLTVGRFLAMTVPHSSPPLSFLEFYLSVIRLVAERIVPS